MQLQQASTLRNHRPPRTTIQATTMAAPTTVTTTDVNPIADAATDVADTTDAADIAMDVDAAPTTATAQRQL